MDIIDSTRHRVRKIKWMLDVIECVGKRILDEILQKDYFVSFRLFFKEVIDDTFNIVDGVYTPKGIDDLPLPKIENTIRKIVTEWNWNTYYLHKPGNEYAAVREVDKFLQLLNVMIMRFDDE